LYGDKTVYVSIGCLNMSVKYRVEIHMIAQKT